MNVLWVRLEFSLDTKTIDERKIQRKQLCELVGSNIQRIGQLRGLELAHYQEIIMPFILEQVKACKEPLAQTYIIESIIQVFPVEYHVETLETLFNSFQILEDEVNTLELVTGIIKRLESFSEDAETALQTVKQVARQIDSLLKMGQEFPLDGTLEMLGNLLNFSLEADSSNFTNVNSIITFVENYLSNIYGENRIDDAKVSTNLRFFLSRPLREMKDAAMAFDLTDFPSLVARMKYADRKAIAVELSKSFIRTEALIDTPEKLKSFFAVNQVILKRPNDFEEDGESEPISSALSYLGSVFHLIKNKRDVDETFSLITSVSSTIQALGPEVKEILYLPLGNALLHLAVEIDASQEATETTVRAVFQEIYHLLADENEPPPVSAFWLFIEAAQISDRCGSEAITNEFLVAGFRHWKSGMIESGLKYRMLISLINHAVQLNKFSAKAYIPLTNEICNCANSLLTKEQQAEAHLLCSHLFNLDREVPAAQDEEEDEEDAFKNPDKIKNCLVRALKATSQMLDPIDQLPWYYKVLAHAVYFIEKGIDIQISWFNALTSKIDQQHQELGPLIQSKLSAENKKFYKNLIQHKEKVIKFE